MPRTTDMVGNAAWKQGPAPLRPARERLRRRPAAPRTGLRRAGLPRAGLQMVAAAVALAAVACGPGDAPDTGSAPDDAVTRTPGSAEPPEPAPVPAGAPAVPSPPPADALLPGWDLSSPPDLEVTLPSGLEEVSGLAFSPAGELFAHGDEAAAVFRLDPRTGAAAGRFEVGDPALRRDFEGIAATDERLYLVDSDGVIVTFAAGPDGATMDHRAARTDLGGSCEVEGLAWDAGWDALVLACKEPRGDAPRDRIRLYHASPSSGALDPRPVVDFPVAELEALGLPPRLHPSGVERPRASGSYLLLAAREGLLVEVNRAGHAVGAVRLPRDALPQAEGLAVGPDRTLWIATEGAGGPGRLLAWRWGASP